MIITIKKEIKQLVKKNDKYFHYWHINTYYVLGIPFLKIKDQ